MGHPILRMGHPRLACAEEIAEEGYGGFGDYRAVGGGDGDLRARVAQGFREVFAGLFGADEQEARGPAVGLAGLGQECAREGLGNGLRRSKVRDEADLLEGRCRCGADHSDLEVCGQMDGQSSRLARPRSVRVKRVLEAVRKRFYSVGAGEEQPMKGVKVCECGVEGGKRGGFSDLNGGNEDRVRTQGAQMSGQLRTSLGGAGDENAGCRRNAHLEERIAAQHG